jgi:hypothetical protein
MAFSETQPALLKAFVLAVIAASAAVLVESTMAIRHAGFDVYLVVLAGLTIAADASALDHPLSDEPFGLAIILARQSILDSIPASQANLMLSRRSASPAGSSNRSSAARS